MKALLIALIGLFTGSAAFAQYTKFITTGTIEYEKKINLYALAKAQLATPPDAFDIQRYEAYKKVTPQFRTLPSTLIYNGTKTLYTPKPVETYDKVMGNDNPMAKQFNTVYADLGTGLNTVQKVAYEDVYLVKDTIRKINWKITDETRDILGYTCRRANAIIMDSIYVVAFYTNEIHVSGGPETFTGLPGMILGVALPHEGITWFATKITSAAVPEATIIAPKKGKVVNRKQIADILWSTLKTWSPVGNRGPYEMMVFGM